jgi:hypothetical protein
LSILISVINIESGLQRTQVYHLESQHYLSTSKRDWRDHGQWISIEIDSKSAARKVGHILPMNRLTPNN